MKMKTKKFEFLKWLIYLLIGLIPAAVFKIYAQPGATYDALYSLVIWLILPILDWVQLKVDTNKEV